MSADAAVELITPLGFGFANVVVAVPQAWIDTRTMADLDEVAKSRLETDAKVYETAFQNSNEMMQSAQEVIQDMKEKAAAVVQAQSESTRGIARNI